MAFTDVEYKFKKIGKNVQIGKNVYFRYPEEVEIGDNVIIDEFCYFTTALKINNYIHIGPFCSVIGGKKAKLTMDDYTALSAGVRVVCGSDDFVNGPFTNSTIPVKFRPNVTISDIYICKHAIIGTNTVILPDVTIGEGAAVSAMTLVDKSLAPWFVYAGTPARRIIIRDKDEIIKSESSFLQYLKENACEA